MPKLIASLIRHRYWLLAAAVLIAGIAAPLSLQVRFDRSVENMFTVDEQVLVDYQRLKRLFGGNEIVLLVYQDEELLEPPGLERLARIRERCEAVAGVRAVLSIDRPLSAVGGVPFLAKRVRSLFENYTHSKDGQTAAVVCMLEDDRSKVSRRQSVNQLREIAGDLPGELPDGVLAGEPVMVLDGFRYLERDGRRLGIWSTVLLGLTILLSFRKLRWVVLAIAVVQWTLLCTRAALVISGTRLSMVSSMLTAIVTVVGVATVVHLIVRIQEGRSRGLAMPQALQRAGVLLAGPIFWACLTDAVGFLSLTLASVGPIQDFGFMTAIGALLVVPAVALLAPAIASIGAPPSGFAATPRVSRFAGWLTSLRQWRKSILVITVVMLIVSVWGLSRLQIETDFSRNFRAASPIVRSYRYIEEELGGAGVIDIILPAPRTLDWEYLDRLDRLEQRLRTELLAADTVPAEPQLTKVLSIADAVVATSPVDLRKSPSFARNTLVTTAITLMQSQMPDFAAALYTPGAEENGEGAAVRIMVRAYERQPAEAKLELIENIRQICREEFADSERVDEITVTGFFVLLANLVASVLRDQWTTFGVAAVGIAVMLTLAFRSLRYAVIAIVPNSLPIIFVLGALGWSGGRVNMGVAMIAAVSLGLSVDSAIHYMMFYRRARAAGKDVETSLQEVQGTVGRAVVFSTLALIVGFSVMGSSEFIPTVYFGYLVSISMLGGLAGNLLLLPTLLQLADD